jgi:hypothetical protein
MRRRQEANDMQTNCIIQMIGSNKMNQMQPHNRIPPIKKREAFASRFPYSKSYGA